MSTSVHMSVEMATGERLEVDTLNADRVKWDFTRARRGWPKYDEAPFVMTTFLAWAALTRTGQYEGNFEDFSERDCVDIVSTADDEDTDDQTFRQG